MGFGFNLFVAFVLPVVLFLSLIFIVYFLITKKFKSAKWIFKGWGIFFSIMILFIGIVYVIHFLSDKKNVSKNDVYGTYVIDKAKYAGKQSNWQYEHYHFEITKKDSFIFYLTDKGQIIKINRGTVNISDKGRITLNVDSPHIQIIESTPTLYRNTFSFYYVFHSKNYNNVFFKKGNWKTD